MKTICIMCPMGCDIEVVKNGEEIEVTGNTCKRGEEYGKNEFVNPCRVVTTLVQNSDYVFSLKTEKPVPKSKISDVLNAIKLVPLKQNYGIGSVFSSNILGLGVDIVVTGISQKMKGIIFKEN